MSLWESAVRLWTDPVLYAIFGLWATGLGLATFLTSLFGMEWLWYFTAGVLVGDFSQQLTVWFWKPGERDENL